jgi:uncharacterized protein YfaS (alpha-2-macroglobulin family)
VISPFRRSGRRRQPRGRTSGQQICIDGVEHGRRYRVTVREGLPAADGETLLKTADLDIFVRDRAPSVRFVGNAYVLPAGGEPTIPVVTVNTNRVEAKLFRIGDRQLARALADGNFLSQLGEWQTDEIEAKAGTKVWEGTVEVGSEINREITNRHPRRRARGKTPGRRLCADRRSRQRRPGLRVGGDAVVRRDGPRSHHARRQ